MANQYDNGALTNLMTTELNSLAAGAKAIGATPFDNAAAGAGWFWGNFELYVTFAVAPTMGKIIEIYLIPSLDGTNYADGDASTEPDAGLLAGGLSVQASTNPQRLTLLGCRLPSCKFKPLVKNGADQAFAASGNILKIEAVRSKSV